MNPFLLLLIFETKHLICDFFLQADRHKGKFLEKGWALPLADHCAYHGIATLTLALWIKPELWWICLVDFGVHFIMDRIKASPRLLGRFRMLDAGGYWYNKQVSLDEKETLLQPVAQKRLRENEIFWWMIGVDQYVHQLTTIWLAWRLAQ